MYIHMYIYISIYIYRSCTSLDNSSYAAANVASVEGHGRDAQKGLGFRVGKDEALGRNFSSLFMTFRSQNPCGRFSGFFLFPYRPSIIRSLWSTTPCGSVSQSPS